MASRTLTLVLAGDAKKLSRTMDRAGKDVGKFGRAAKQALKLAATAAVGLGLALGATAVKGALELERGLAEVQTLLPELTDKGFGKLRDEILAMSSEMGIATDAAIPALYDAISAGVPPDNVVDFLTIASKAAIGGVTDLGTATDALTTITNTWGKTAGVDAARAADVLFTAVRLGKTTMEEIGGSINQVAGLASSFGVKFEQVAAGFTEVTKAGVPTAEAMTKMRALIQAVTAPTTKAAKVFDDMGIAVSATRVANEGLLPVLTEIMGATAGNESLQRKLFGSVEALQAALVITEGGGAAYAETLKQMGDAAGATDAAFMVMDKDLTRRWEKTMVRVRNALTRLGLVVLPTLADALDAVIRGGEWMAETWQRSQPQIAAVTAALGVQAAFLAGPLVRAWRSVADRVRWLWGGLRRLAGNIAGPLREAHARLVKFLHDKMSAAWTAVTGLVLVQWGALKDLAAGVVDRVTPALEGMREALAARLGPALETVAGFMTEAIAVAQRLASVMREALSVAIVGHLIPAIGAVGLALNVALGGVVGAVLRIVLALWDAFGAKLTPVLQAAAEAIGRFVGKIQEWYESLTGGQDLLDDLATAWGAIQAAAQTAVDAIVDIIDRFGLKLLFLLGPVGVLAYGIIAFWDEIKAATSALADAVAAVWEKITGVFAAVWETITGIFAGGSGESNAYVQEMIDLWTDHMLPALESIRAFMVEVLWPAMKLAWAGIVLVAENAWAGIVLVVEAAWKVIEPVVTLALAALKLVFELGWNIIKNVVDDVFMIIVAIISTAFDVIKGVFDIFRGLFTGDWGLMWEGISGIVESVWALIGALISAAIGIIVGIVQAFDSTFRGLFLALVGWIGGTLAAAWSAAWGVLSVPIDAIKAAIEAVIDAAGRVAGAVSAATGVLGDIGGGFLGGLKSVVPGFAEGGIVTRPTLAMLGEAGPEAIIPERLWGGGRQVIELNLNVYVDGSVISEGDLSETLIQTVQLAADRGELRLR